MTCSVPSRFVGAARGRNENQSGQALAEALVVLGALASLVAGITWLGRLQDVGLQLTHASRRVAFAHAHQGLPEDVLPAAASIYSSARGHSWAARQGTALLRPADPASRAAAAPFALEMRATPAPERQVGDPLSGAAQWRTELGLGDGWVWRIRTEAHTDGRLGVTGRLGDFDRLALRLHRAAAILRGSGAAADDADVQRVLANSERAWGSRASASLRAGREVQQRLRGVDAAWQRAQPDWDWLSPWAGQVPQVHLTSGAQP